MFALPQEEYQHFFEGQYPSVYQYSEREGPMVICWYKNGQYPDSGFKDGMRLVWFADDSVNPWKWHVFGNWDWHEAAGHFPTRSQ